MLGEYRQHLRRKGFAPSTVTTYLDILRAFSAAVDPETATTAGIESWLDSRPLGARARLTYVCCIAGFYEWANFAGKIEGDPSRALVRPKLPRRLPRPIETDSLILALEAAPARMKAWLCLAAYQGLRCHEIAALRMDNLRTDVDPPVLHLTTTKGSKDRVVPLADETLAALEWFGLPMGGWIFPTGKRSHIGANRVSHLIATYLHDHGIPATAHMLRHWFGTELYRRTRDIKLVGEMMGHVKLDTTSLYVALVPSHGAIQVIRALKAVSVTPTKGDQPRSAETTALPYEDAG